jgi:hypothetical protein
MIVRKYLVPLSFLLLMAGAQSAPAIFLPSRAQDSKAYVRHGAGAPSVCPVGTVYVRDSNGHPYTNNNGSCVDVTTLSGGGGAGYGLLLGGQPLTGNTVTNSTLYGSFGAFGTSTSPNTWVSTESQRQMLLPVAVTFSNMCFEVTAQPTATAVTVTFRDNAADTALTFTVPAAGVFGVYCDNTHSVSVTAGHLVDFKVVNNDSSAAFGATQWSVAYK